MSDLDAVDGALRGVDEMLSELRRAAASAEDIITATESALAVLAAVRTDSDAASRNDRDVRSFEDAYGGLRGLQRRAVVMSEDATEIVTRTQRASAAIEFARSQVAALSTPDEAERLSSRLDSAKDIVDVARTVASHIRDNAGAVADMFVHAEEPQRLRTAVDVAGDHVNRVQGATVAMRATLAASQRGATGVSQATTELKQSLLQRTVPPSVRAHGSPGF